jgi:hypothetical protein
MSTIISLIKRIPFLRTVYDILKGLLRRTTFLPSATYPYTVILHPPFLNEQEFLDTYHKAQYFLPSQVIRKLCFRFSQNAAINTTIFPVPDYLVAYSNSISFELIHPEQKWLYFKRLIQADYILVWDETRLHSNLLMRLFGAKTKNIDRHKSIWDGWIWASLGNEVSLKNPVQIVEAQNQFNEYISSLPKYTKSYVFGTGPSLDQAYQFDFSDGYRIVCNTVVKNKNLLKHISPHFIVAADAIYHFGNNRHAYQFRCDLEKALDLTQSFFLTPDFFLYLLKNYHPRIYRKTIPIRTDLKGVFLDMKNILAYSTMPNILNGLLLPLGSSLADEIILLGFDGRAPNDKLFWQNSGANSYEDLKPTIMAAHPGFFKGRDYKEYARSQSDSAEKIMTLGEQMGKKYYCLNQTFIPAMQKRMYPKLIRMG